MRTVDAPPGKHFMFGKSTTELSNSPIGTAFSFSETTYPLRYEPAFTAFKQSVAVDGYQETRESHRFGGLAGIARFALGRRRCTRPSICVSANLQSRTAGESSSILGAAAERAASGTKGNVAEMRVPLESE
jgi:hypothetical protein